MKKGTKTLDSYHTKAIQYTHHQTSKLFKVTTSTQLFPLLPPSPATNQFVANLKARLHGDVVRLFGIPKAHIGIASVPISKLIHALCYFTMLNFHGSSGLEANHEILPTKFI